MNHLETAVLADLEKAAALRGEQSRGTDADAALGPLLDKLDELYLIAVATWGQLRKIWVPPLPLNETVHKADPDG